MKIGQVGKSVGFEWGGDWTSFLDLPHLQMTLGYTLQDFQQNKVDLTRFQVPKTAPQQAKPPTDTITPLLTKLNSQVANKDYKGARDTTSYLFNELTKIK